jgi:hypothetical protein
MVSPTRVAFEAEGKAGEGGWQGCREIVPKSRVESGQNDRKGVSHEGIRKSIEGDSRKVSGLFVWE